MSPSCRSSMNLHKSLPYTSRMPISVNIVIANSIRVRTGTSILASAGRTGASVAAIWTGVRLRLECTLRTPSSFAFIQGGSGADTSNSKLESIRSTWTLWIINYAEHTTYLPCETETSGGFVCLDTQVCTLFAFFSYLRATLEIERAA